MLARFVREVKPHRRYAPVAAPLELVQGKLSAWSNPARREAKRSKDESDLLRPGEEFPEVFIKSCGWNCARGWTGKGSGRQIRSLMARVTKKACISAFPLRSLRLCG